VYLAAYYTACERIRNLLVLLNWLDRACPVDIVLLYQYFYYAYMRRHYPTKYSSVDTAEQSSELDALLANKPHRKTTRRRILGRLAKPALSLIFVISVGAIAWALSGDEEDDGKPKEIWDPKAQIAGWTSAVLYCQSFFRLL
jgi:hypothetical protein